MPESRASHLIAVLSMAAIAAVWGGGFPATKYCLQAGLSVGALLALRFAIGTLGLGMMLVLLKVPLRRRDVLDGLWLGLVLVTLFWLQTDGLRFTTTSKSGFITGLYVIFTPMVALLVGDRLRPSHALGALVALTGLVLLVREPGAAWGGWNRGDSETLLAAVLCGFHIVMTSHFSRRSSGWVLAFVQVAVTGAVSLVVTLALPAPFGFQGAGAALSRAGTWAALAFMGVLATSLAFYVQSAMQARLGATESGILLSTEPVWTAAIAVSGLVPGIREHLSPVQLMGGLLILAATLVTELGPRLLRRLAPIEAEDTIG
ncbi:MAG: DMT family transporter [Geothrix sp.]|uniref:DMT family transporter n=1 Tax=Candidatus Geothrix odensensis TaxID=2954440 RepID=A0A936F2K2_9BACT|nr:DMT family transporter [Candidatus Geothrix odensensis]MBK8790695.1 DMT family transporter [Holophagaceae bacterium]MBP7618859.1 DMT family transporter [Geothrix sp.]MCC6513067.1 DMT family transporter [Geothrix sp.]